MIDQDRRKAAHTLREQGIGITTIARHLHIDIKTVRSILSADSPKQFPQRKGCKTIDETLLEQVFDDCAGYAQRMHEVLTEEHGIDIGYSTLTRLIRSHELRKSNKKRSAHVPDSPGDEMQHDTSIHNVRIGDIKQNVVSSGLYLRYSKMRFVKFYRTFNRFTMECFIDEALRFWGYCAQTCIIDNTNLAILHGTGPNAVINPQAAAFADRYGFCWKAHRVRHANRKAGKEKNFHTIETNFFPGRTFRSLEDMNTQAFDWATVRYAQRPQSKTRLIPVELFEIEKPALIKLPEFIQHPYRDHKRIVDQYGYCSFNGNYYWIPEKVSVRTVTLLEFATHLRIMQGCQEITRYDFPPDGTRNEVIAPPGHSRIPQYKPRNRKRACQGEEKKLRAIHVTVGDYLDFVKSSQSTVHHRAAFVRWLYSLSRAIGESLLKKTLERALEYHVVDRNALTRIAQQIASVKSKGRITLPPITPDYHKRQTYQEGEFSNENDITYE